MAFFAAGCSNPYARFYKGNPDARAMLNYDPIAEDLQIYSTNSFDKDVRDLVRRGYQPIGESSFNTGENAPEHQLREQAKKIGAHVALVSSQYTNTTSGAIPLSVPRVTNSYSNATATAYGSGGTVNAYGSGTTTTYGSETVMMPYSVARYDVGVVYLAKVRSRVGIHPAPIDDAIRRRIQTNSGVLVDLVTEGTTAFQADILPGDVILAVGGDSIQSDTHYIQLLDKFEGQTVSFKLDRDGKRIEKQIEIRKYEKRATPN